MRGSGERGRSERSRRPRDAEERRWRLLGVLACVGTIACALPSLPGGVSNWDNVVKLQVAINILEGRGPVLTQPTPDDAQYVVEGRDGRRYTGYPPFAYLLQFVTIGVAAAAGPIAEGLPPLLLLGLVAWTLVAWGRESGAPPPGAVAGAMLACLGTALWPMASHGYDNLIEVLAVGLVLRAGRFASNNTVFDSSYIDYINKTNATALKIFVSLDKNATSPKSGYTSSMIKGFMQGIIGMQEGQTKTTGPIPPQDAYGANKFGNGAIFTTQYLALGMNQTVEVVNYITENLTVKWIQIEELGVFTMPQLIIKNLQSTNGSEMVIYPPPYYIWENATTIINITDTEVTVKTNPTKSTNLSDTVKDVRDGDKQMLIFPNATTATWDNDTITVTCSPIIGRNYTFETPGYTGTVNITIHVNSIIDNTINVTITNDQSAATFPPSVETIPLAGSGGKKKP